MLSPFCYYIIPYFETNIRKLAVLSQLEYQHQKMVPLVFYVEVVLYAYFLKPLLQNIYLY